MTLAQRPVRTCEYSRIIESDSERNLRLDAGVAQQSFDDATVLHVRGEQQSGTWATSVHVTL